MPLVWRPTGKAFNTLVKILPKGLHIFIHTHAHTHKMRSVPGTSLLLESGIGHKPGRGACGTSPKQHLSTESLSLVPRRQCVIDALTACGWGLSTPCDCNGQGLWEFVSSPGQYSIPVCGGLSENNAHSLIGSWH